jgi:cell division protein FtsQ
MDGQRRIARPMKRRSLGRIEAAMTRLAVRVAARSFGVIFLATALLGGAIKGEAFQYPNSPFSNMGGKFAGLFGFAAQDIRISGLAHHAPEVVLSHIGVKPGGSLVGFNADDARILLESLDWVADAEVQRSFPNRLAITLNEREPFAIWQVGGNYSVIDRGGVEMSGLNPLSLRHLPLVTGKGANKAIVAYVNQLEAIPALKQRVQAAARVGERRWTLYLDNGVKIALPEKNADAALQRVADLDAEQNILSKGITGIDLRTPDRMVVTIAEPVEQKDKDGKLSGILPR